MGKQTDIRTMLLTASPWQLIVTLSLPDIVGMVVVSLFLAEYWRIWYSGRIFGSGIDRRVDFYFSSLFGSFRIS